MNGDDRRLDVSDMDDDEGGNITTVWRIPLCVARKDMVSGFMGTVTARAEYSTGCKQYLLTPIVSNDGEYREPQWLDEDRLVEIDYSPSDHIGGPQHKPAPIK